MSKRTVLTLSACGVGTLVVFGMKRIWRTWHSTHLNVDAPVEISSVGLFV